jgi:hypothetical protein
MPGKLKFNPDTSPAPFVVATLLDVTDWLYYLSRAVILL